MLTARSISPLRCNRSPRLTTRGLLVPIFLLLTTTLTADPEIESTRRDDGTYQFTLTSKQPIGVGQAQAAILIQARQLCGELVPQLDSYRFSKSETFVDTNDAEEPNDDSLVLVQDISCNPPTMRDNKQSRSLTPEDKTLVETEIRTLTVSYLHGPSDREYRNPYSMLSDYMQSIVPFETWRKQREEFVAEAGSIQETDIWRTTIYVDPPSAPEPGIYVAADYEMSFENVPFLCGYLVWVEQPDRTFRITREETGVLDASTLAGLDESDIPSVKSRIGCRDQ